MRTRDMEALKRWRDAVRREERAKFPSGDALEKVWAEIARALHRFPRERGTWLVYALSSITSACASIRLGGHFVADAGPKLQHAREHLGDLVRDELADRKAATQKRRAS